MQCRPHRIALAIALLSSPQAFAADEQLPAVVVTATRQPLHVNDSIAGVTVIDRGQIEETPATTLGELLGRQAGIEFTRAGGPGATESVYLRGSNSDHLLVLIDGQRVSSATLGAAALELIPLAQIDHVEILRGTASALYGADALGGVIQIFTRNSDKPGTEFSAGAGNRGSYETSLQHQGRTDAWRYGLSVAGAGTQGINQIRNTDSAYFNADKDGYRNQNASVNAAYDLGDGEIGFRHFLSDSTSKYDTAVVNPVPPWNYLMADADWSMRHEISGTSAWAKKSFTPTWTSSLTVSRGTDEMRSTPSATLGQAHDFFKTRSTQGIWQNDFTLPLGTALVALERLDQAVESTMSYSVASRRISSAVLGWNGDIGKHAIQVNVRVDSNSQFGRKQTQNLGYAYRLTDALKVSMMTGTAFKAPTFNQLYFPAIPGVGIGNPGLKAESAHNQELRVSYNTGQVDASLTYFHKKVRNLINWGDAPAPYFLSPSNIGSATIKGWEGETQVRIGDWSIGGNLTLQDPKDDASGLQLNRRAQTHGLVYVSRQWQQGTARMEATGTGRTFDDPANTRRLGGYGLVNIYVDRKMAPSLTLFGRIENLFDRNYLVSRSNPMFDNSMYYGIGTSFLIGIRYQP